MGNCTDKGILKDSQIFHGSLGSPAEVYLDKDIGEEYISQCDSLRKFNEQNLQKVQYLK